MTSFTRNTVDLSAGATVDGNGTTVRVWAPERHSVALVLVDTDGRELKRVPLEAAAEGYFVADGQDVEPGSLYMYQLDDDSQLYADPASHFQPLGVFGPS